MQWPSGTQLSGTPGSFLNHKVRARFVRIIKIDFLFCCFVQVVCRNNYSIFTVNRSVGVQVRVERSKKHPVEVKKKNKAGMNERKNRKEREKITNN